MLNRSIQSIHLKILCDNSVPVSIYLLNGIKLSGIISSFDEDVILLKDPKNTIEQLLYKHAISTIVPNR